MQMRSDVPIHPLMKRHYYSASAPSHQVPTPGCHFLRSVGRLRGGDKALPRPPRLGPIAGNKLMMPRWCRGGSGGVGQPSQINLSLYDLSIIDILPFLPSLSPHSSCIDDNPRCTDYLLEHFED